MALTIKLLDQMGPFTIELMHSPFIDYCYYKLKWVGVMQPIDNREKGAWAGAV